MPGTDVTVVPSTTDQVVEQGVQPAPGVGTGVEAEVGQEVDQSTLEPQDVQTVKINEVEPTDERGVPLRNVEMEYKRKYEQLIEKQPEVIEQAVRKVFESQQAQNEPQYTEEQLDLVIYDDTGTYTAANKAWASQQKSKMNEQKISQLFEQKFQMTQQEQQKKQIAAQSEQYVINTFPEMFIKDATGSVQWNNKNPMTQLVAQYMNDPAIKSRPDALREAARQAFADYNLSTRTTKAQQQQLQTSQEAQIKKQQMSGGTGVVNQQSATSAAINAAYEKMQRTGDPRDAAAYNILRKAVKK